MIPLVLPEYGNTLFLRQRQEETMEVKQRRAVFIMAGCYKTSLLYSKSATLPLKKILTMWTEKDNALQRTFEFRDFSEAFSFMTRVALIAEKMDHHPRWTNVWNRVEIILSTHDAGNTVTDRDRRMAEAIDGLLK